MAGYGMTSTDRSLAWFLCTLIVCAFGTCSVHELVVDRHTPVDCRRMCEPQAVERFTHTSCVCRGGAR